jgi:ribosomal protein S24E
MTLTILKETENKLFNRREIKATMHSEISPSHEEVGKLLSEKFKTTPEKIKIKNIKGKFGVKVFTISANIYNSKKEKDELELKKKKEIEREKKANETSEVSKE